MLDDYLKTNPGVKDLPRPGSEPQPPSPQSDAITIRPLRKNKIMTSKTPIPKFNRDSSDDCKTQ